MRELIIKTEDEGRRLDKYLFKYLDKAGAGTVFKGLRKKNIKLNEKKAEGNEILKAGDKIELYFSEDTLGLLKSDRNTNKNTDRNTSKNIDKTIDENTGITAGKTAEISDNKNTKTEQFLLNKKCKIIYEDDNIIIADKPAGLLSQKAKSTDESINEILLNYVKERSGLSETFVPSVCNRLDRNTSGLITFAKTYSAARMFSELFSGRDVKKYYLAVVKGRIEGKGRMKAYILKDNESNSVKIYDEERNGTSLIETAYESVDISSFADGQCRLTDLCNDSHFETSCLRVELLTGKPHQIRAHFACIGHPVIGDPKYGDLKLNKEIKKRYGIDRQLLHSYELVMPENMSKPFGYISGKIFKSSIPDDLL